MASQLEDEWLNIVSYKEYHSLLRKTPSWLFEKLTNSIVIINKR
jgi:hypothetical protein